MTKNILKHNYEIFIGSFKKINLNFFLILILDIAFYLILMQLGSFFLGILQQKALAINLDQNILGLNQEAASGLLGSVRGFFFFMVLMIIAFIFLTIAILSIFKGTIWSLTASKKPTVKFIKKFFLLNVIWLPAWFILVVLFATIIKPQSAIIFIPIIAFLAFYFTNIIYPLFLRQNKINVIKKALNLGIKKIHHFIIPYAIIAALAYVTFRIYNLIALDIALNSNAFLFVVLVYAAWLRYYFIEIISGLRKTI